VIQICFSQTYAIVSVDIVLYISVLLLVVSRDFFYYCIFYSTVFIRNLIFSVRHSVSVQFRLSFFQSIPLGIPVMILISNDYFLDSKLRISIIRDQ